MNPHLSRFPSAHREAALRFAALSDRVGQLAEAHPFLFFALATGYGTPERRAETIRLVERGRPLREICEHAGIPYALRRLAPEDLAEPFPEVRLGDRASEVLAARIERARPLGEAKGLLDLALLGARIADEAFGVWLSDQRVAYRLRGTDPRLLYPLALYAWGSRFDPSIPSVVWPAIWTPRMNFGSALAHARRWLDHLKFHLYFGATPIEDPWAEGGHHNGFSFEPLLSFGDLMGEVLDMHNCLHGYADRLRYNQCRLFGVRHRDGKLGTLELQPDGDDRLQIVQFKGPYNRTMPTEALMAAEAWLGSQRPFESRRTTVMHSPAWTERLAELVQCHARALALPPRMWSETVAIADLRLGHDGETSVVDTATAAASAPRILRGLEFAILLLDQPRRRRHPTVAEYLARREVQAQLFDSAA